LGWISVRLIHKAVVGLHNGQGFPDKALYLAFDIRCSYYGDKVWAVERDLYNRVITSAGFTEENVPSSKELHWMVSFPLTGAMHKWVQVKISKDPNDTRNYEKLVKVLGSCDEEKSVSPKV